MSAKAVFRAYGLWLLGVLSAAAAAWFLHRSRLVTYEAVDEGYDAGDGLVPDAAEYELGLE